MTEVSDSTSTSASASVVVEPAPGQALARKLSTVGDSCLRRIVGGFSSRPEVESSPIELRKNRFCLWLEEAIEQVEFELRR